MLAYLKELFNAKTESVGEENITNPHNLKIAACALMLEIASADDDFSDEEKDRITELMRDKFELSDLEVTNIISRAEEEIDESVSIYEFTDIINKKLNSTEKYSLLKYLWHIAYADGNLDTYEDYFIKKISNNLHLHNKERIAAKMEVKEELGL